MANTMTRSEDDGDVHKGALEGDRPDDEQQGNRNAQAINDDGLPVDPVAVEEDRIGANAVDDEVANADEAGRTTDAKRDELKPLE